MVSSSLIVIVYEHLVHVVHYSVSVVKELDKSAYSLVVQVKVIYRCKMYK